ncbi:MAG: MarR family transcriptional regulator [Campylobacterales bacterium]|nr:MarR family transcriptional regulator [Campylobacterales bacterium]
MAYEQLKLDNQICFPVYASSRLIINQYQPYLDKLGITYPQYLVLLVLWEKDHLTVNEIGERLILKSNTITPLLKRMEGLDLISRSRDKNDERKVIIKLTKKAKEMEKDASLIPETLVTGEIAKGVSFQEMMELKKLLNKVITLLS